jgi:hypothetical protein
VHLKRIEELTGQTIQRVIELKTHFDDSFSFAEQIQALVASVGLSATEWQTAPLLINPPTLNVITALLLAELHGRCGYFPPVLRLRLIQGHLPPAYEVAEILDLQQVRDQARRSR